MRNAVLLGILLVCSGCDAASDLPVRKDCIVGIELDWPANTPLEIRARVVEQIVRNVQANKSENKPLLANPKDDLSVLYAQYKSSCDQRYELMERLMAVAASGVRDMPGYDVMPHVVEPGPATIEAWGPDWRDRPDWAPDSRP